MMLMPRLALHCFQGTTIVNTYKRRFYVRLMPVQHAQIAKHALAFGNEAAIQRYVREFQTELKQLSQYVESKICE